MVASDTLSRLENLWRYLEDEGLYTKANTVYLAIEEIKIWRCIAERQSRLAEERQLEINSLMRISSQ